MYNKTLIGAMYYSTFLVGLIVHNLSVQIIPKKKAAWPFNILSKMLHRYTQKIFLTQLWVKNVTNPHCKPG